MFKKANVVMLPTNEKATNCGQLALTATLKTLFLAKETGYFACKPQHLYITSDEEIKNNDWFYDTRDRIVSSNSLAQTLFSKKIIATTDTSLEYIKHETYPNGNTTGIRNLIELPQLSKEFIKIYIEEYNKGNVITKVIVEYSDWNLEGITEVPKVNPKDNTITIKKIKDSWTREEVITLCKSAFEAGNIRGWSGYPNTDNWTKPTYFEWEKQNL